MMHTQDQVQPETARDMEKSERKEREEVMYGPSAGQFTL